MHSNSEAALLVVKGIRCQRNFADNLKNYGNRHRDHTITEIDDFREELSGYGTFRRMKQTRGCKNN